MTFISQVGCILQRICPPRSSATIATVIAWSDFKRLDPIFPKKIYCIPLLIMLFGLCSSVAANPFDQTHLHASEDIVELDWIEDFSFVYDTYTAQRQEVVRYSMQMKKDHVEAIRSRQLPWTSPTRSADPNWVIGYSHGWPDNPKIEPQELYGYTITDEKSTQQKLQVILVGSNHAREDPGCWALHGLVEFLLSDDPRADLLRKHVIFYVYPVVNPDGKLFYLSSDHAGSMTVNGNPELKAAGETNHNRVWQTSGLFQSIDVAKNAMLNDPTGKTDYLLDFHGIPMLSFSFAEESAALSPLGRALSGRGHNIREGAAFAGYDSPSTLRSWANSENGPALYSFTPEIRNQSLNDLFLDGKLFALALLDVIQDEIADPLQAEPGKMEVTTPPPPVWWAPDSADDKLLPWASTYEAHEVSWSEDAPFPEFDNQSIVLNSHASFVDFGRPEELEYPASALTVSIWAKPFETASGTRYLISVYEPSDNQRSWTLSQRNNSPDFAVTLSADGTHNRRQIKRQLSNRWPYDLILYEGAWRHLAFTFDGTSSDNGVLKLFLDGEQLVEGKGFHFFDDSQINELFDAAAHLRMGALEGRRNAFPGALAEAAIWNQALSPEEIRWLAHNSLQEILAQ